MAPVSVFISRQTQRLYVRQAFQPIFDTEVTIRDPDTPIGTTIYTALGYANDGADVRWSALAMYAKGASPGAPAAGSRRGGDHRRAEGASTDAAVAKAALERISIPQEAIERINEVVSPGSSLIVSDEPMSAKETGKGTDFIVLMSGEPQGGIKTRRRPNPGLRRLRRRSPLPPLALWRRQLLLVVSRGGRPRVGLPLDLAPRTPLIPPASRPDGRCRVSRLCGHRARWRKVRAPGIDGGG